MHQRRAQSNLGFMYATGVGVPQNDAEAVRWYRLASAEVTAAASIRCNASANRTGVLRR